MPAHPVTGNTLLTETYRPEERAKVQGSNDFIVFGVQALSSVSAGALILGSGWQTLNLLAIPGVALVALATATHWLARQRLRPIEK